MSGSNGRVKDNGAAQPEPRASVTEQSPVYDLSIIVVSYNTAALLQKCLTSVYANQHPDYSFEVLVLDNASSDNSAELVKTEFPQVDLVVNSKNLGFAAAVNQAFTKARGTYLLLLNPDTEVIEDAIWKMVEFLEEEPQAAVVGPALLYPNRTFQESAFGFPSLWQIFLDFYPINWRLTQSRLNGRYPRELFEGRFPQAFEIDFPLGACMLIRQAVLEKMGSLDENFFMYMEEIDLCYRIKQAEMPRGYGLLGLRFRPGRRLPNHWKIYCLPSAKMIHHAGASTNQFREEMYVQLHKSRYYFFQKHYGPRFRWAARNVTRLGLMGKITSTRFDRWRGKFNNLEAEARLQAYNRVWNLK
jgi:N-acetylglucosaminyl-diphospho-decaprenol L-rhamnosyltransferase